MRRQGLLGWTMHHIAACILIKHCNYGCLETAEMEVRYCNKEPDFDMSSKPCWRGTTFSNFIWNVGYVKSLSKGSDSTGHVF